MTEQINEEAVRLKRLEDIKSAGVEAYPARSVERVPLLQARQSLEGTKVKVAGRLVSKREMGKLCFSHFKDFSDKLQVAFSEKELGKEAYKFFVKNYDLGDFVWVEGEMFTTHKGETSVLVKNINCFLKRCCPCPKNFMVWRMWRCAIAKDIWI